MLLNTNRKNTSNKKSAKLLDNYIIIEQIGSGSFGEVYLAEHKNGKKVAVKVEDKKKANRIESEYEIYRHLQANNFVIGVPTMYDYLQSPDYNIMVMQLLGPNLEDLFVEYSRSFSMSTIFMLATQLLVLLEKLHGTGYIHRDIKPNNFLIGMDENISQVYIMDFGLSKKFMSHGKHIKFQNNRSLIGTARYASVNMHMGIEPSRRDDLESVGYMLVYFCKGSLPWQGIKKKKGNDHIHAIGEKKMSTSLDDLCDGLPSCFRKFLAYCRKLKFDETPDYDYIQNLFFETAVDKGINYKFDWMK